MSHRGRRPTIRDVADAAGVALSTASKALNGRDRVDPRTRLRVQRVAEDLGYRPNVRAQRLRTGQSHAIALMTALPAEVVSEASELGFLLELSLPIAQECLKRGYALVLVPPTDDTSMLNSLDVDGAIVVDPLRDDQLSAPLRSRGIPVVTIGASSLESHDGYLDRGRAGSDAMLAHLAAAGARHVAVVLSTEPFSLTLSLLQLLADPGELPLRVTILRAPAAGGGEAGSRVVARAVRADPSIDAIYAPLDSFAVGAVRAAEALGRRIPDELMVATNYDGTRAARSVPTLTALNLGLPEMGARAVDLLFRVMAGEREVIVQAPVPQVVERASTAGRPAVSRR